jgi:hypothetical protein
MQPFHLEEATMKTDKNKSYDLKLTPQQQAEVKELTGKEGEVITFRIEELEERIMPKIVLN